MEALNFLSWDFQYGNIFLKLINMSITASYLALAVMALRLVLKKAPRWIFVALWAMVGLRLVLPWSFESIFSLIPNPEPVPPTIMMDPVPQINSGIPFVNSAINPVLGATLAATPAASVNPMQIVGYIAWIVWLVGMAAMAVYTLVSYLALRRKVQESIKLEGNIYQCDRIPSPFILGLFSPKIYLPSAMREADIPHVIAHERAHLKRLDHIWKPLGFALLTIYWFNPILWVAYILLCRDIEAACDERVLRSQGSDIKKAYSEALLSCSISRKHIAACPLAFGEVGVKQRIKNVLNYKRPAFWIILIALIASLILGICFLTNPTGTNIPSQLEFQICQWIKEENAGPHTDELYATVNYEIIGKESSHQGITVYMWVLYEEFSFDHGQIQAESGSHLLTAITAEKQEGSNYRLIEYWTPEDGSRYRDSIVAKLPWYLLPKALDSQRTIDRLNQLSQAKADAYFAETYTPGSNMPLPGISMPENTTFAEHAFPQDTTYLGLDVSEGLTIYVWQMGQGLFSCVPVEGKNHTLSAIELLRLYEMPHGNLEETRAILSTYGLADSMVRVAVVQMPYSSYIGRSDDAFVQEIRKALGLDGESELKLPYFTSKSIPFSVEIASTSAAGEEIFPLQSSFPGYQEIPLPIWRCASRQELQELESAFKNSIATDLAQYGLPSFQALAKTYGDGFFQDHALLVIYAPAPDSGFQFQVENVIFYSNGKLQTNVAWAYQGGGDTQLSGRLIFVAVEKSYYDICQDFSANLALKSQK